MFALARFSEARSRGQVCVRYLGRVKAFVLKCDSCLRRRMAEIQDYFFNGWSLPFMDFYKASDHQCLSNM